MDKKIYADKATIKLNKIKARFVSHFFICLKGKITVGKRLFFFILASTKYSPCPDSPNIAISFSRSFISSSFFTLIFYLNTILPSSCPQFLAILLFPLFSSILLSLPPSFALFTTLRSESVAVGPESIPAWQCGSIR